MYRRGFSLFEMLVVLAVSVVIAGSGFLILNSRRGTADLQAAASEITTALRAAQINAVNAASSTSWGVRFDNTTSTAPRFAVFASSSYSLGAQTTEYRMTGRVAYDDTSVPPGTVKDVVFGIRTGTTASTSVILRAVGTTKTYVININAAGLVTVARVDSAASTSTAPTVSGISPNSATNAGSVSITSISGTNFVSGATVKLRRTGQSDITGTGFSVSNATTISGGSLNLTGAQTGVWDIVVTNPDSQAATCSGCFTISAPVAAPTATDVSPSSLAQGASSQNLTVTGTGFVSGASAAVSGTGVTVNSTTFVSQTSLTVNVTVAGNATTGARNVTVTNPDTQAGTCSNCFTVNLGAPTVSAVAPSSRGQGVTGAGLTITGTNFVNGSTPTFSGTGITVTTSSYVNATTLSATITVAGNATTGARNVTVTNPDTQAGTGTGIFTVNVAPTVTTTSPSSATQGASSVAITVTGTGFASGATASVSGTGVTVNSTTFVNATTLTMNVTVAGGASVGARDVTVTNSDGGSATLTSGFAVTASVSTPTVVSISPTSLGQGATSQTITITGTGFASGVTASFSGTGITVNSTTFASSTQITANVTVAGNAATTTRDVTATNSDTGAGTGTSLLTITSSPTVTNASPSSRPQGASSQNVVITGTGFASGVTASFSGTGITVNSTTFASSTQITANVTISAGAATGTRNITATNNDGGVGTGTSVFTVNAIPTTVSASPNSLIQGASSQNVVITGTGYASGAAATFSGTGITINSTTFNSATQVTANVTLAANATVGARNITVTNSDGGVGTGTGIFTVTANQQNTGYLLGSGTPTTANTWTAPSSWFTNEAPPTASTQVAQVAVTSGSSPAPTVLFKGFSLGGATSASSIDKICVLIDNNSIVTSGTGTQRFAVALTWDGGTSFTTENAGMTDLTLTTFTGTDYYFKDQSTAPGTSDPTTTCTTWGRTWSAAEMSSANFGIRVKATNSNGTSRTIRFDTAQVKVYYTP